MAFDTVIDKAQLEGAITASANAIREKTGDTALIEWLSDKGFAEAIAAIESGGGIEPFADVLTGTHTPANDETSITFLPATTLKLRYFMLNTQEDINTSENYIKKMCVYRDFSFASRLVYKANGNYSMPNYLESNTNEELLVFPGSSTTVIKLQAGITYRWIAVYE